jgi:hypothetical protein
MAGLANEAMRQAWDGPEGANWSELAEGFERASTEHRMVLLGAAALARVRTCWTLAAVTAR